MTKTLRSVDDLLDSKLIKAEEAQALNQVASQYAIAITPQMQSIIHHESDQNAEMVHPSPVSKQFIPDSRELQITAEELYDPVGDFSHSPVKGVVHRFGDRCLLKPVGVCAVYCRFCFRREFIGPNSETLNEAELQAAFQYIKSKPQIWEVILTGGDPLILKPKSLAEILKALSQINHVEVIRIHTRIPVVDSARINDEMIEAFKIPKTLYVALHTNHASEFTEEAITACQRIIKAGIPMVSQTVLLKGINNDVETLAELMKTLVKNKIKPYYLHHPDLVHGTSHFRISVEEGRQIMEALRKNHSGLCIPSYVQDTPGGNGGKKHIV